MNRINNQISRRDFLKLAGMLPLSFAAPRLINSLMPTEQSGIVQNVIVVVFDAFSAYDISLYGYQRETTPNIARWAERAVVYHNHHAGGNFTTPGTASLLTGTFPWTHRALGYYDTVDDSFINKNIFAAFQNHYRLAYTHNPVANRFLSQFSGEMEDHVPLGKLFLTNDDFIYTLFGKDEDTASVSWVRAMKTKEEGYAYSLFLARLYEKQRERMIAELRSQFPGGVPHIATDDYFLLEDGIAWLGDTLSTLPQPFMGYFHFWPPHDPYNTNREFFGHFDGDGFWPATKPVDLFSKKEDAMIEFLLRKRTNYDEYILYVDQEFGRLMDRLDASGVLENAWVVLTSDHGEMFERGILGHWTPVLYEPVIHVPLMILEPGKKRRQDIYENTSAVDVLPTLLHVTGQEPAVWSEGVVLPPFTEAYNSERNLYAVQSLDGERYLPITVATTALIKGQYKLMYFFGYEKLGAGNERVELYDIKNDPEELNDLASTKRETTADLLNELKQKLAEKNKPYLTAS
jgi:arylsulfatase A-like enzyme